jgi:hypothetical protein
MAGTHCRLPLFTSYQLDHQELSQWPLNHATKARLETLHLLSTYIIILFYVNYCMLRYKDFNNLMIQSCWQVQIFITRTISGLLLKMQIYLIKLASKFIPKVKEICSFYYLEHVPFFVSTFCNFLRVYEIITKISIFILHINFFKKSSAHKMVEKGKTYMMHVSTSGSGDSIFSKKLNLFIQLHTVFLILFQPFCIFLDGFEISTKFSIFTHINFWTKSSAHKRAWNWKSYLCVSIFGSTDSIFTKKSKSLHPVAHSVIVSRMMLRS